MLSEHRWLRFLVVFLLYVSQGAPIGIFFFAIPAWLAASGASALEMGGFLSATSLPWTLKFVNGFLMDRFTFLPMGRRRAWLISAQTIMVATLIAVALVDPGYGDIAALSAFSFLIMTATTFQDVAVDGMAVDLIPDAERARASGLMFGGQSIGIAAGTAFTGFTIAAAGFPAAMLGNAGFVGVILLMLIFVRERPGERLLPWTRGRASDASVTLQVGAWSQLIREVWQSMLSRDCAYHVVAQVSQGAIYGLYIGVMPLIATNIAGWSDAEFSGLTGSATLIAGLLGICVFGVVADKLGSRPTTIVGTVLLGSLTMLFWYMAPHWDADLTIKVSAITFMSTFLGLQIAICASAMKICSPKVAATQFTLLMALANFGITLASAALGMLEAIGGYQAILAAMVVMALICGTAMFLFNEKAMKARVNSGVVASDAARAAV